MGERKVLNKYYPPDFDPAKLPRGQRGNKDAQMKVRMMLAMSIRCTTCGNYMYKGTKFTMRMEDAVGEEYLGIRIFRFYFNCKQCAAEITMKTDPKNSDYAMEHGATRNYEPWRDKDRTVQEAIAAREEEERGNAMKALENRTLDSKKEMDIMDALEELQALNGRHGTVDTEAALRALRNSAADDAEALDAQDEEVIRNIFSQRASQVQRLDESAATAALLDSTEAKPSLSTINEHWDGGSNAAAAAEAAAAAKKPPEKKPTITARVAIKPKFAVKPKQAAAGSSGGDSAAEGRAVAGGKRPAEDDAGSSGAADQPAPKRPVVEQDAASPASSDAGGKGLVGLLGDYGSDSSN